MASWSIHLTIAKELNNKLKLEKNSFYFGNLLPDVDEICKINRFNTHYYNEKLPFPKCPKALMIDTKKFLDDYKEDIKNPLILGYYCHLLVDNYYNNLVCSNYWIQDRNHNIVGVKLKNGSIKKINSTDKILKKYKHGDFELYGRYLFKNINLPIIENNKEIFKNVKYLKNKFYTKDLVMQRLNYLETNFIDFNKLSFKEKIIKHNYKMFTKEKLDIILEECIYYVLEKLKEIGIE
ncbi:MAG: zinc dependent phospholipase C family protein [Bacilli bacterium]|nr:zinc dependent phospholipase C family protein [Bacilli bacterium]